MEMTRFFLKTEYLFAKLRITTHNALHLFFGLSLRKETTLFFN